METDSFFYQLLKQLPETLFQLLGLPAQRARAYRFDSVEVKKSFRIDGLFLPRKASQPLYFVEVQFQPLASFYANLFAKVFCYLEENDPGQEWQAVAIFPGRSLEPAQLGPYEELLNSRRVWRIYLDEYPMPEDLPPGLRLVQLLSVPDDLVREFVARINYMAEHEIADSAKATKVVKLLEEFLIRRFRQFSREEIRMIFELHDLRKTRFWQEAHEEGEKDARTKIHSELVPELLARGMGLKEIAAVLKISVAEVRRLAKAAEK